MMTAVSTTIQWDGIVPTRTADTLAAPGGLLPCATKVGYILMTTDGTTAFFSVAFFRGAKRPCS
jgi:hypothetical protein